MLIGVAVNSLSGGGGLERQAHDLIEGLLARGRRLVVFAKKLGRNPPFAGRAERLVRVDCRLVPGKLRDAWFSRRLKSLRSELGIDCLIACNRMEPAEMVICGGNHLGYLRALGREPGFFDRRHIAMERRLFGGARGILACSRMLGDELVELYGARPERVKVVYPAADPGRFRPAAKERREELRHRFGFPEDRKVFVFPSNNHDLKGLPFLRSFFESADLPVALAVAGKPAREGRNVRSLGYVPDIESLYQAADATVLASAYETFGMVGVESVLCGTPALMSSRAGCCEAIGEPALVSFRPDSREELEAGVRRLLSFDRWSAGDLSRRLAYDPGRDSFVNGFLDLLEAA